MTDKPVDYSAAEPDDDAHRERMEALLDDPLHWARIYRAMAEEAKTAAPPVEGASRDDAQLDFHRIALWLEQLVALRARVAEAEGRVKILDEQCARERASAIEAQDARDQVIDLLGSARAEAEELRDLVARVGQPPIYVLSMKPAKVPRWWFTARDAALAKHDAPTEPRGQNQGDL